MKKLFIYMTVLFLFFSFHTTDFVSANKNEPAEVIFINATIHTSDEKNKKAEAIAIRDGKFIYVGDNDGVLAYRGEKTKYMDLNGKSVLPGMIDGHMHAYLKAEEMFSLDLSKYDSFDQYQKAIKRYLRVNPNVDQLRATGWKQSVIRKEQEEVGLTPRELIDRLVEDIPFVAISKGRQELWINTKAVELAKLDKKKHRGIETNEKTGELTGVLRGYQIQNVVFNAMPTPDFTKEQYKHALLKFQKQARKFGLTGAFVPIHFSTDALLQAFKELDDENKLTLYYDLGVVIDQLDGLEQIDQLKKKRNKYRGKNYKLDTVKIYGTNSISGDAKTVIGDETFNWDQQQFNQLVTELDKEGFRIHVHASGPSITQVLDGFEYALNQNGLMNARHALTSIPYMTKVDIARMKKLGLIPVPQPIGFYRTTGLKEGDWQLEGVNRMESYFKEGLPVVSSSNYPIMDLNPLKGIETGITRLNPNNKDASKEPLWPIEGVTLEQMISSYTINAAYLLNVENQRGSIQVGKQADFVVLEKDISDLPATKISEIPVLFTYFNGKKVY